jgi:aminopeptidase YwaD
MMRKIFFACLFTALVFYKNTNAQNIEYAKSVIKELCSEQMYGRGYVNDGNKKAADFIKKEYQTSGTLFFGKDYFQEFGFQVNTFPYNVEVKLDDRELVPGEEYIVDAGCPTVSGVYDILTIDSSTIDNQVEFNDFIKRNLRNTFLVVDRIKGKKFLKQDIADQMLKNGFKARGLIFSEQEKLTWSTATEWTKYPIIYFTKGTLKRDHIKISVLVEPELMPHNTQNVIGYLKGSQFPDSFIVFSAHYDHLGMMGKWALFPGANDNASGVAMMLDILKYYSKNKPKYSIAFMAFSAEEVGLFGSYFYTEHPLFPLKNISMLINLDLMGTGDKGMTVVNATLFPKEFQDLQLINITKNYLLTVNPRGKAQNSDHYYFSENGVKAFYFYLMGEYHFYHDVYDLPEVLTLSKYGEAFNLIVDFTNEYCLPQ